MAKLASSACPACAGSYAKSHLTVAFCMGAIDTTVPLQLSTKLPPTQAR